MQRGLLVTFTGWGCLPGERVYLVSHLFPGHAYGSGAITATSDQNGRFRRVYRVPRGKARGTYPVTFYCALAGNDLGVVVAIHVL